MSTVEEVIYHSTAYAGFPADNNTRRAALATLLAEGSSTKLLSRDLEDQGYLR